MFRPSFFALIFLLVWVYFCSTSVLRQERPKDGRCGECGSQSLGLEMVDAGQVHLCRAMPFKGVRTASTKAQYGHSVRTPSVSHHSASLFGRSQSPDNMRPEVKAEGGDKR